MLRQKVVKRIGAVAEQAEWQMRHFIKQEFSASTISFFHALEESLSNLDKGIERAKLQLEDEDFKWATHVKLCEDIAEEINDLHKSLEELQSKLPAPRKPTSSH